MQNKTFWEKRAKESSVLNPVDRIAEVLFGLIMVLSFTGTISAANDGRQEIKDMLWAALGCNLAWGFVDAIMYLMNVLIERGHALQFIKKFGHIRNNENPVKLLKDEIQPAIAALLTEKELISLGNRIKKLPPPSKKYLLTLSDFKAAGQIFLLVFLCTFPVAIPFGIFKEVAFALRASNIVALVLLFSGGYILASYAGFRPFLTAFIYTLIGLFLVAITISLGG
jgi:hypothetical protein